MKTIEAGAIQFKYTMICNQRDIVENLSITDSLSNYKAFAVCLCGNDLSIWSQSIVTYELISTGISIFAANGDIYTHFIRKDDNTILFGTSETVYHIAVLYGIK